jgi:WG containing repeat
VIIDVMPGPNGVPSGISAGALAVTRALQQGQVFRTDASWLRPAASYGPDRGPPFGWHFQKDGKWGLLDLDGRVILDAEFDQGIDRCTDGRLGAYKNKEWLYFKSDGSPLQPPDGRLLHAACSGSSPPYVLRIGDKFGLIDAEGRPVTPVTFDALNWAFPGAWNAKEDGKWGRIGPDGGWMVEPKFDYLSSGASVFVAGLDGKRGFLRADGKWVIEPRFDAAGTRRDDDTAFVTIDGRTGVLRLKDQSWGRAAASGRDVSHHARHLFEG